MASMEAMLESFKVHEGLLDMDIGPCRPTVMAQLRRAIIRWVADDGHESMEKIFRCARMCCELANGSVMSDLTLDDVKILLSLSLNPDTEGMFRVLNAVRGAVTARGPSPSMCHSAAMSVFATMNS